MTTTNTLSDRLKAALRKRCTEAMRRAAFRRATGAQSDAASFGEFGVLYQSGFFCGKLMQDTGTQPTKEKKKIFTPPPRKFSGLFIDPQLEAWYVQYLNVVSNRIYPNPVRIMLVAIIGGIYETLMILSRNPSSSMARSVQVGIYLQTVIIAGSFFFAFVQLWLRKCVSGTNCWQYRLVNLLNNLFMHAIRMCITHVDETNVQVKAQSVAITPALYFARSVFVFPLVILDWISNTVRVTILMTYDCFGVPIQLIGGYLIGLIMFLTRFQLTFRNQDSYCRDIFTERVLPYMLYLWHLQREVEHLRRHFGHFRWLKEQSETTLHKMLRSKKPRRPVKRRRPDGDGERRDEGGEDVGQEGTTGRQRRRPSRLRRCMRKLELKTERKRRVAVAPVEAGERPCVVEVADGSSRAASHVEAMQASGRLAESPVNVHLKRWFFRPLGAIVATFVPARLCPAHVLDPLTGPVVHPLCATTDGRLLAEDERREAATGSRDARRLLRPPSTATLLRSVAAEGSTALFRKIETREWLDFNAVWVTRDRRPSSTAKRGDATRRDATRDGKEAGETRSPEEERYRSDDDMPGKRLTNMMMLMKRSNSF
eukprot:Selendium_serpulae@DN4146_c0_g1_i1.p1